MIPRQLTAVAGQRAAEAAHPFEAQGHGLPECRRCGLWRAHRVHPS